MKLVILIGDAAVGKMTVGQELMKLTGLRLFHNHMAIELVIDVLGYYDSNTIVKLRDVMFEAYAQSDNEGLIFTYMWAFDHQSDWDYIAKVCELFEAHEAELYYVELVAPLDVRLERNVSENRLAHKASKRDIEASNQRVINDSSKYRTISYEDEIPFKNYIKIDNSNISAKECAERIVKHFNFEQV